MKFNVVGINTSVVQPEKGKPIKKFSKVVLESVDAIEPKDFVVGSVLDLSGNQPTPVKGGK